MAAAIFVGELVDEGCKDGAFPGEDFVGEGGGYEGCFACIR